jgi:hypothetical protein
LTSLTSGALTLTSYIQVGGIQVGALTLSSLTSECHHTRCMCIACACVARARACGHVYARVCCACTGCASYREALELSNHIPRPASVGHVPDREDRPRWSQRKALAQRQARAKGPPGRLPRPCDRTFGIACQPPFFPFFPASLLSLLQPPFFPARFQPFVESFLWHWLRYGVLFFRTNVRGPCVRVRAAARVQVHPRECPVPCLQQPRDHYLHLWQTQEACCYAHLRCLRS